MFDYGFGTRECCSVGSYSSTLILAICPLIRKNVSICCILISRAGPVLSFLALALMSMYTLSPSVQLQSGNSCMSILHTDSGTSQIFVIA